MTDNIHSIIITGATSSLGTALIDECIKKNIEVLALANPGSKNLDRITKHELVHIEECALNEFASFEATPAHMHGVRRYDALVHLAWAATQGDAARGMLKPQAENIEYALDAVDLADRFGCGVFVGSGSQAEYGRTKEVLTETTECHPETPYGIAKLCAGALTRLSCRQKKIRHVWPRILSAYGPKCQPQSVINYALTELLEGRSPKLTACEQIWDFIYTADAARALLLLAEKGHDGEIYCIGSGESRPLREYMETARDIAAPRVAINFGAKEYGPNTVMHLACNISKLRKDTGYEPQVPFDEGIQETIMWLEMNSRGR